MKMEMPKMDVVRFQEADVIVASGDHRKMATIAGWGNGVDNDATLTFTNGQVTSYTFEKLKTDYNNEMLGSLEFRNSAGNTVTVGQLASDENSYSAWNGKYERTASGHYEWYSNQ